MCFTFRNSSICICHLAQETKYIHEGHTIIYQRYHIEKTAYYHPSAILSYTHAVSFFKPSLRNRFLLTSICKDIWQMWSGLRNGHEKETRHIAEALCNIGPNT